MNRVFLVLLVSSFLFAVAVAAPRTYRYRCVKCGLIQEYSTPGVKKCPNDGRTMVRAD